MASISEADLKALTESVERDPWHSLSAPPEKVRAGLPLPVFRPTAELLFGHRQGEQRSQEGAPDPDNAASSDWVILLEACTIVDRSPERLRVAKSTLEKKIVKRRRIFRRAKHFLDVEDTIHEFTPCIFVLNFTSTTPINSSYLCRERRSES
jgi:hypothetical protein